MPVNLNDQKEKVEYPPLKYTRRTSNKEEAASIADDDNDEGK